jgi:hypothetical protein
MGRRVDPVGPQPSQQQERIVGHAHQKEPAPPGEAAEKGRGGHGGQPTRHKGRGSEGIEQAQSEDDRFHQAIFPLQLQFLKGLLVSGKEDGVAGDGRGKDQSHGREGEKAVSKEPFAAAPGAAQEDHRRSLGQTAFHDGPAHGHHADQEVKDGRAKAMEKVVG